MTESALSGAARRAPRPQTFLAPIGYLNAPRAMGKRLMPDSERAALVRRAFQDFATGRFTKHEVRKAVIALGL